MCTSLALKCPTGSQYNPCATACRQPTCQDPAGPGGSCSHPCVEGCVCDPGLILSGDKCVPLSECGCNDEDGKYRPVRARRENFKKEQNNPFYNTRVLRRWETLGSQTQTAQSVASATATTMSPASPGGAAQRRSARWSTDCWTATQQVHPSSELIPFSKHHHFVPVTTNPKLSVLLCR